MTSQYSSLSPSTLLLDIRSSRERRRATSSPVLLEGVSGCGCQYAYTRCDADAIRGKSHTCSSCRYQ